MYIWQQPDWPSFTWGEAALRPRLDVHHRMRSSHGTGYSFMPKSDNTGTRGFFPESSEN
ncbi:MAG TPA: DUF4172 domain-containing protein [Candidatus Pseudomonas excrementavium]|nr:DUF4172 domain-containing protein [Candidatus Pseudomonas excrementavium]